MWHIRPTFLSFFFFFSFGVPPPSPPPPPTPTQKKGGGGSDHEDPHPLLYVYTPGMEAWQIGLVEVDGRVFDDFSMNFVNLDAGFDCESL